MKLSLLVVMTFVLMWTPMIIFILIGALGKLTPSSFEIISHTLMLVQGSINPIIYCFRHASFKRELKKMYIKRSNKIPTSSTNDTSL